MSRSRMLSEDDVDSPKLRWMGGRDVRAHILDEIDPDYAHLGSLAGVYVIWYGLLAPTTVRVGQGVVKRRLAAHRRDPAIRAYDRLVGPLLVSWACVPPSRRDGVERYLAMRLRPRLGTRFPAARPIVVNLPWEAAANRFAGAGMVTRSIPADMERGVVHGSYRRRP